jgi:hypothetical protein
MARRPLPRRPRSRPQRRVRRPDDSLLIGGLSGIALVTAATIGLTLAGALIAGVVALLYS